MWSVYGGIRRRFFLAVLCFQVLSNAEAGNFHRPFNNSISSLFIFGDSTVDSGNNNDHPTILKSNFLPYGMDFPNQVPTGRFTDGRLVTDFIAAYVGLKEFVPPYAQPGLSLEELMTGVSFGSGGSGFDPLTPVVLGVIPMKKQLEFFREYKRKMEAEIGKEKTEILIRKAAFLVSAGTNDISISYYSMPHRRIEYDVSTYLKILLENAKEFLEELRKEGARNVGVVGLPPLGCLPATITIDPGDGPMGSRRCNESLSIVAVEFNEMLENLLEPMRSGDFRIFFVHTYKPLADMIKDPSKFGFENADLGCCGTGLLEVTFLCNPLTPVCKDPSRYVFFDAVHPSEATYKYIFKALKPTIDDAIQVFSQ